MPDLLTGSIGGLLILGGLAMIFVFPSEHEYQSQSFSYAGMLVGLIMVVIGILVLVFT